MSLALLLIMTAWGWYMVGVFRTTHFGTDLGTILVHGVWGAITVGPIAVPGTALLVLLNRPRRPVLTGVGIAALVALILPAATGELWAGAEELYVVWQNSPPTERFRVSRLWPFDWHEIAYFEGEWIGRD